MDAAQAISAVVQQVRSGGLDYPTQELAAARFEGGWCVYAPALLDAGDPMAVPAVPRPPVFLVDDGSGRIQEVADPDPESLADACLWFTASRAVPPRPAASGAPSAPQLWPPRRATDYDRQAVDALAQGLARERDFAGWLAARLAELADLLGGSHSLIARAGPLFGGRLQELIDLQLDAADGPREAWRDWPAAGAAKLTGADTAGWLLAPPPTADPSLDDLEPAAPAAMRLAVALVGQLPRAAPWRACGVIEFAPPLVALRLTGELAADLAELRRLGTERPGDEPLHEMLAMLLTPSPGDPDVEALLRLAIDAEQHGRDSIDLDVAAAAAYRRVLDRLGLPFDTEAYNMMFE